MNLLTILNDHVVVRRLTLAYTLWLTWESYTWAAEYAYSSMLDGMGTAAVIAAVMVPVTALQGFAFKHYSEGRK